MTPDNTPDDDMDVWNSIVNDTTMIFQWESTSATAYLKKLMSKETVERIKKENPEFSYMDLLSIGNGAIRPAGESYRGSLAAGIYKIYGNEALDEFMKPTLGYLVYQEQVIEFLHLFCGYTMGNADLVRRSFAKKLGTQDHLPKITAGFNETMSNKYGVSTDVSNVLIGSFIQVIEDASDYLFSKNHSDPYSWIGYICGYLRYHYPLEFITTALNIFEDKNDKSIAIVNYAKSQGIQISPIKFRYSLAKYSFNKEQNVIFKGISSIKYMNDSIASEMYELRNNEYKSFVDLLYDLKEFTTVDSRQIQILIKLNFFSEFGDIGLLLSQYDMFEKLGKISQVRKEKMYKLHIDESLFRKYSQKETERMFLGINSKGLLNDLIVDMKYQRFALRNEIEAQLEYLGYIDVIDERYSGLAVVMDVDTKYAPRLQMYSLRNGTTIECKIDNRTFNKCRVQEGDIVRIKGFVNKPKQIRQEDGSYKDDPSVKVLWITNYEKAVI